MHPSPRVWPVLVGAGLLLGLGPPLAKLAALAGVPALSFALWPTAVAGGLLALLALRRHRRVSLAPAVLRFGLIAGLLGHALPMSAVFWLAAHAGAGFSALAFALPPVFTLAVALLVGLERFSGARLAAVGIGLCGALLLVTGRGGSFAASTGAVGVALAIPALIGAGNVYRARYLPAQVPGEWLGALTLLSSSAVLALVGLATNGAELPQAPAAWGWLAVQAAALVGGYRLYFVLQRRAGPVTFSFMGYVMMLTGAATGAWWFGERLPWTMWPALGLIVLALGLMQRPRQAALAVPGIGARTHGST
jgi:drug/metabolite transporter (DMT)-like permease